VQVLALVMPALLLVLIALWRCGVVVSYWPLPSVLGGDAIIAAFLWSRTRETSGELALPAFELEIVAPLLACLNQQQFQNPLLKSLQSVPGSAVANSSVEIAKLRGLAWMLELRRSEYFALALAPLLWGTNLAMAVERWRVRNGQAVCAWLKSIGEFEALLCLGRYAYEHPDHVFPEVAESAPPFLRARAIGHPLLSDGSCVRCDVALNPDQCRLMIVSGSNMSGKSTLLRAVGVNIVLQWRGLRCVPRGLSCRGCRLAALSASAIRCWMASRVSRPRWSA
jgi:hypothetical protein